MGNELTKISNKLKFSLKLSLVFDCFISIFYKLIVCLQFTVIYKTKNLRLVVKADDSQPW